MLPLYALAPLALVASRAPAPVMMGGLTGLPRVPAAALPLTRPWNPSGAYSEPIATLWRDLETLFDTDFANLRLMARRANQSVVSTSSAHHRVAIT